MTRLQQLFTEMVAVPPPSRLRAEEVYRAGRQRRRRGLAVSMTAVGLAVALVAGGAAALSSGSWLGLPPADPRPTEVGPVRWAGVDADQVYLVRADCLACPTELLVSSDRGVTWTVRGELPGDGSDSPTVLGPGILAVHRLDERSAPTSAPGPATSATPTPGAEPAQAGWLITIDGGQSWATAVLDDAPMDAAAPGNAVFCVYSDSCELRTVDPANGHIRPLATQPTLHPAFHQLVPPEAGLWISGVDPATGRPAVAVSHDRGRSWATHVFTDLAPVVVDDGVVGTLYLPEVVSADGRTAYAALINGGVGRVYRSVDGGATWQAGPAGVVPGNSGGLSYVTSDHAHILNIYAYERGAGQSVTYRYLASRDGQAYAEVVLAGLPDLAAATIGPGGRYVAHDGHGVYLSDDGWTWRQIWVE